MGRYGRDAEIVQRCDKVRSHCWNEFERIRPRLVEVARYFYPQAVAGLTRDVSELHRADAPMDGDDDANRLTCVPFEAFRVCVNGFYVHLTGPNTRWFKLGSPKFGRGDDAAEDVAAEDYAELADATRWLIRWSGAYKQIHAVYRHLTAFGFAALMVYPDRERYVGTEALRVGTYAFGIGRDGRVNRIVRRFSFDAEQLAEEFGEANVPETARRCRETGDLATRFTVWNLVEPHDAGRELYTLSASEFSYRSVYWCADAGNDRAGLLAVRGFKRRPFVAPRINHEKGDVYGRGLCMDALGHAKMLQTVRGDCLDMDDQNAHPAMMAPASMSADGLRLAPYEVNFYSDGAGKDAVYRALQFPLDGTGARTDAQIAEQELRRALLNSEFETINAMEDGAAQGGRMTATEVQARVSEKMEQLAGIATTLDDEWLDPFVTLMARHVADTAANDPARGDLPPIIAFAADGAADAPMEIKYESKIHAAANAQSVNAGFDSLQRAGALGSPEVMDNFDVDEIARDTHRMLGAPESWLKPARVRDAEREERAAEAARQQEMAEAAAQAKTLKEVASTPVDPRTLGGALAGAGLDGALF